MKDVTVNCVKFGILKSLYSTSIKFGRRSKPPLKDQNYC